MRFVYSNWIIILIIFWPIGIIKPFITTTWWDGSLWNSTLACFSREAARQKSVRALSHGCTTSSVTPRSIWQLTLSNPSKATSFTKEIIMKAFFYFHTSVIEMKAKSFKMKQFLTNLVSTRQPNVVCYRVVTTAWPILQGKQKLAS